MTMVNNSPATPTRPGAPQTSTIRYRTILVGPDEILWEMWGTGPDGKDFKMMASRYTRKSKLPG